MGSNSKSKILIFGATGYLGKYMVKASVSLGHPTCAFVRPINPNSDSPSKLQIHKDFESMGVTIIQGELEEHEKLVRAVKQVDVVISTLPVPQHLNQLKIVRAIEEAGNIKRFVPSEFGNEVDRARGLAAFEELMENKRKIRRATEAAKIPYTYVAANALAAYFIDYTLHPSLPNPHLLVYGSGQAKVVLNYEEDVAVYTVRAANDPAAENRVLICRPALNITTQLDLISSWENKTGLTLGKTHVPEEQLINLSQNLPFPDNIPPAILHNIFIKGEQMRFDLTPHDLEASTLYPDHNYTSLDDLLSIFVLNPLKVQLSAFA